MYTVFISYLNSGKNDNDEKTMGNVSVPSQLPVISLDFENTCYLWFEYLEDVWSDAGIFPAEREGKGKKCVDLHVWILHAP